MSRKLMQLQVAVNAPSEDVQWTRIRPHNHAISLKRPALFERKTTDKANETHEHKNKKQKTNRKPKDEQKAKRRTESQSTNRAKASTKDQKQGPREENDEQIYVQFPFKRRKSMNAKREKTK